MTFIRTLVQVFVLGLISGTMAYLFVFSMLTRDYIAVADEMHQHDEHHHDHDDDDHQSHGLALAEEEFAIARGRAAAAVTDKLADGEKKSPPVIVRSSAAKKPALAKSSQNDDDVEKTVSHRVDNSSGTIKLPIVNVSDVNCRLLFAGDENGAKRTTSVAVGRQPSTVDFAAEVDVHGCAAMTSAQRFVMKPPSADEAAFPIAFGIVLETDVTPRQFGRLLRAIYRPQNVYCIHVEQEASDNVRKAMTTLAGCFENVFVAKRSINSTATMTLGALEAQLVCMEDLLAKDKTWTYFINLHGGEFPLKTNGDIVRILKIFNGANNLDGTVARLAFGSF